MWEVKKPNLLHWKLWLTALQDKTKSDLSGATTTQACNAGFKHFTRADSPQARKASSSLLTRTTGSASTRRGKSYTA